MSEGTQTPEEVNVGVEETVIQNPFARLISVITEPTTGMRGAVEKPGQWWAPLLLMMVGTVLFALLAGDVVREFSIDQMQTRIQEMVDNGRIDQEQAAQIIERQTSGPMMTIGIYAGPIVNLFVLKLILTLLALLVGNVILGGNAKFGQYWSIFWWAGVVAFLSFIIGGFMMKMTGDIQSAQLGLGVITKGNPEGIAHKILQIFEVFRIWEAIIAGIGVSIAAKAPVNKSIVWMLVIYLGIALIMSFVFGNAGM